MCPKIGRPKVVNPKDIDIKVRVDKATNEKLLEYADKHNITRAEAVRCGIDMLLGFKQK